MPQEQRLTWLGQVVIILFIIGCAAGAWWLFANGKPHSNVTVAQPQAAAPDNSGSPAVEIGVAYGTEKKKWMEAAVQAFAQSPEGRNIRVNLIPMGSLEGAHAILEGNKAINVWSPASSLYKDIFLSDWEVRYGGNPILKEEQIALSPMVFVFWADRYDAFVAKYGTVSFATISQALAEKGGWGAIANKPDWGLFKFGHTNPNNSNSGLMALVLIAYNYYNKTNHLTLKDVVDPKFQASMDGVESGVSGLSNSTGNMMREMVLKGPSAFDALFVYESVVLDYIKNAEGRWGDLRVVYPAINAWNDNPYYILNVPWSTPAQQTAADAFLKFLLSEPVQKESLVHGFRPANTDVPVLFPGSPFETYRRFGLQPDIGQTAEPPKAEVVNNLLAYWLRSYPNR